MPPPAFWRGLLALVVATPALLAGGPATATPDPPDRVVLQLRWDDQFQFAGYYAAHWQGFYREEGLEVRILSAIAEDGRIVSATEEVTAGRAHFGIGAADILIARDRGAPLVILASVFQSSAAAFYAREDTRLERPADLMGLRVARKPGDLIDVELQAMLRLEGLEPAAVPARPHRPGLRPLLDGEVDVLPGYRISAPFFARQEGIRLRELRPQTYGVDFYGDSLFTRREIADDMLLPVLALSEHVAENLPPDSPHRRSLGAVKDAAMRARALVGQIMSFSRRRDFEPAFLRLDAFLDETMPVLREVAPPSVEIRTEFASTPQPIVGDSDQLQTLLLHLVGNAVDAMEGRPGTVAIGPDVVDIDEARARLLTNVTPGRHARIVVADTGRGMPPHVLERVFDPFFTTKEVGEGTGLGLTMVHGIVVSHGGAITIDSTLGEGTTVSVYLPLASIGEGVTARS